MTTLSETTSTSVPAELSSSTAKLVYLYLMTSGATTADQLQTALGLGKLTLFPILRRLERSGYVEAVEKGYVVNR